MTPGPGIEPGTHWWEPSALTTAPTLLPDLLTPSASTIAIFTITVEIHARSLVNFYGQYADRHMNLKFGRRVSEREREIRQLLS